MDAALLTGCDFWQDPVPMGAAEIPDIPALAGHVLFETSGSSGLPKWVALSKHALLISAAAVNQHLNVTRESCWGLALPLNHVGGFGVAARAYQAGCPLKTFTQRWEPGAFGDWLTRSAVTHTSVVPAQVHDLVRRKLTAAPSLVAIVVGGGHLDETTGRAARDLGWPILASYGMTEAGSQVATQGLHLLERLYQPSPISMLPIWQARINDEGILSLSGPALFSGYFTGTRFIPRESDWHTTSDHVALAAGMITPLGRRDLLVKILGELVDPESVEREILALAAGSLAAGSFAVIVIPDGRAGSALVPVFEASVDSAIIKETLLQYETQAPGFKRLRPAEIIAEFPRGALGKLRRSELLEIYHNRRVP